MEKPDEPWQFDDKRWDSIDEGGGNVGWGNNEAGLSTPPSAGNGPANCTDGDRENISFDCWRGNIGELIKFPWYGGGPCGLACVPGTRSWQGRAVRVWPEQAARRASKVFLCRAFFFFCLVVWKSGGGQHVNSGLSADDDVVDDVFGFSLYLRQYSCLHAITQKNSFIWLT